MAVVEFEAAYDTAAPGSISSMLISVLLLTWPGYAGVWSEQEQRAAKRRIDTCHACKQVRARALTPRHRSVIDMPRAMAGHDHGAGVPVGLRRDVGEDG
jgi:hypothetical protein